MYFDYFTISGSIYVILEHTCEVIPNKLKKIRMLTFRSSIKKLHEGLPFHVLAQISGISKLNCMIMDSLEFAGGSW